MFNGYRPLPSPSGKCDVEVVSDSEMSCLVCPLLVGNLIGRCSIHRNRAIDALQQYPENHGLRRLRSVRLQTTCPTRIVSIAR
jgi:hypothetical protein